MKCIDCDFYIADCNGCVNDGDTTNPEEDIFCAEVEGEE